MSAVLPGFRTALRASSKAASPDSTFHPLALRALLLFGVVAAGVLAIGLSAEATSLAAEPSLVRLLRGMALIKGGIALLAVVLSAWRFGRPLSSPAAAGYLVGTWSLCAATTLIWDLRFIPAAALVFHVAMVGLLALAWREGRSASDGHAA